MFFHLQKLERNKSMSWIITTEQSLCLTPDGAMWGERNSSRFRIENTLCRRTRNKKKQAAHKGKRNSANQFSLGEAKKWKNESFRHEEPREIISVWRTGKWRVFLSLSATRAWAGKNYFAIKIDTWGHLSRLASWETKTSEKWWEIPLMMVWIEIYGHVMMLQTEFECVFRFTSRSQPKSEYKKSS